MLTTLPEALQARAAQAIAEAFPGAQPQSLEPLHGGLSGAPVYKLVVEGRAYVLRIILQQSMLNDPVRQLACLRLAAERGIAPPIQCANAELGVSISSFIAHESAIPALRRSDELVAHFGDLMRCLHAGPAFPVFLDAFQMIEGGLAHLAQQGVALPALTQATLAEFATVKQALGPHLVAAPCHNDINPGNVLYDGRRLWLIDWESACTGDPLFDLAGLIGWFVLDARQEATLLQAYFGRAPGEQELAKLALMKHVSWWFYAVVFLLLQPAELLAAGDDVDPEQLPSFAEMLGMVGRGELAMSDASTRLRMSLVLAKQSRDAMRQPAFRQAIERLAAK